MRITDTISIACGVGLGIGLSACSGADARVADAAPDAPSIDAPPATGDFSCVGTPWPTTAPSTLILAGGVTTAGSADIMAEVELRAASDHALLGRATTVPAGGGQGQYSIAVATGGTAPDVYAKAMLAGFIDGYAFNFAPIHDPSIFLGGVGLKTPAELDLAYRAVGLTRDVTKATIFVAVDDCVFGANTGAPELSGSIVTLAGAERVVYMDRLGRPDPTLTFGPVGSAWIFNAPVGDVDVVVRAGAVTYRSRPITTYANADVYSYRLP